MNCFQQMNHNLRALDIRQEHILERTPLREMNVQAQVKEIGYYFLNEDGKFNPDKANEIRAALNDWLNPETVLRMYRSADCAGLLKLVHDAFVNGLEHEIDKQEDTE